MPPVNTYEQVPYPGRSIAFTHPDRLATIGRLMGLEPAPVDRCRVLELGCGDGMNILPMAELLPGSEFVGIDYTSRHIETAQSAARELGIANAQFATRDIRELGDELGSFDYIVSHGVYSWVPPDVRDALLRIAGSQLTADGIAYISFNTLPGWHIRRPIRDLMRFRIRGIEDPVAAVDAAYEMVKLASRAIPAEKSPLGFLLSEYIEAFEERGPVGSLTRTAYALHDEMGEVNDPVYFADFAEHAGRHGLRYLAEAEFQDSLPSRFPSWVNEALGALSGTVEEMEQYRDFFLNRMFRRTLLCRADREPSRTLKMDITTLRSFYFRGEAIGTAREGGGKGSLADALVGDGPVTFRAPDEAAMTISHPVTKAVLAYLGEQFPRTVSFDEVASAGLQRAGKQASAETLAPLAADLMQAFSYSGRLVSLHVHDMACAPVAGERPLATKMSRYAAAHGAEFVTNVAHMQVEMNPVSRYLLPFLDGTRDRADLLAELQRLVDEDELDPGVREGETVEHALSSQLEHSLASWAERGLLLA